MVSNFDKISEEIKNEAESISPLYGLDPKDVIRSIMEIVAIEDRHRIRSEPRINKRIKGLIDDLASAQLSSEDK